MWIFKKILDQVDEIVYISDLDTYELLYLNRYGCEFLVLQRLVRCAISTCRGKIRLANLHE